MSSNVNLDNLKIIENKIIRMMLASSTAFESLSKSEEQKFTQSCSEYLTLLKDIQDGLRMHISTVMEPMPYANSCYAPRIALENAALTTQLALSHIKKLKEIYSSKVCCGMYFLFKDVLQWGFICIVVMIGFQVAFFTLTIQAAGNPWEWYPKGTLGVGFTIFIGEEGDAPDIVGPTKIAMMGSTYSTVKENSDKEWKFYRYGLITEFLSTSAYPPPLNIIFGTVFGIKKLLGNQNRILLTDLIPKASVDSLVFMKQAKDRAKEKERLEQLNSLNSLSEFIRESTHQAVVKSNDARTTIKWEMKNLQTEYNSHYKHIVALLEKQQATFEKKFAAQQESIEILHRALDSIQQQLSNLQSSSSSFVGSKE